MFSANTTGTANVDVGGNVLDANTTASNNTAIGYESLSANTTGYKLVAVGKGSLLQTLQVIKTLQLVITHLFIIHW